MRKMMIKFYFVNHRACLIPSGESKTDEPNGKVMK